MFEEQPLQDILEPFGFEVSLRTTEPPIDLACDDPDAINNYAADPQAYIEGLAFQHPSGFTEVDRGENDEGDIYSVAVRAKTVFAQLLLCADSTFAHDSSPHTRAYADVYRERMRQISTEGFNRERDDGYEQAELSRAAGSYCLIASLQMRFGELPDPNRYCDDDWPWDRKWFKPRDPRRNLVKAGALILAEIERLDRAARQRGDQTS
ncbi:hypothetical protein [Chromohalobacter israelensis]|uniref:hypothetical protein n=1 Tax=Chromohalobacter israelensis TaxID=141390 RepID=UPI00265C3F0B|nr:hypothetical protein [Chromohalobacter salexigens]MDO0945948.1 hypothetical protein [Chromohalobacter salexigens]